MFVCRLIVETNRQNLGYKLTINNFSDKTSDEMTKYMGLMRRPEGAVGTVPFPYTEKDVEDIVKDLPKDYDTRLLGYVTYVKSKSKRESLKDFKCCKIMIQTSTFL